jgi:hypothetical protein
MLCATCPWDRNCFSPPSMTSAEIDRHVAEAARKDEQQAQEARMMGRPEVMPAGTLMFALRLRSSGGRKIADTFKGLMQEWDDEK